MKGNLKMSGVQEGGFSIIPEGIYYVQITEVKDKYTQSGDAMPSVKLTVTQGDYQDNWVWDNIILSEDPQSPGYKMLGRAKKFFHIIGQPYEGDIVKYDTNNWLWKKLRVRVFHNKYQGKVRAKVDEHLSLSDDIELETEETPF